VGNGNKLFSKQSEFLFHYFWRFSCNLLVHTYIEAYFCTVGCNSMHCKEWNYIWIIKFSSLNYLSSSKSWNKKFNHVKPPSGETHLTENNYFSKESDWWYNVYNNRTLWKILFPGNKFHLTLDDVIEMYKWNKTLYLTFWPEFYFYFPKDVILVFLRSFPI